MDADDDSWVLFLSTGLLLVVGSMLFLGGWPWFLQYGVLLLGLVFCVFSVSRTR